MAAIYLNGKSGAQPDFEHFETEDLACQIAAILSLVWTGVVVAGENYPRHHSISRRAFYLSASKNVLTILLFTRIGCFRRSYFGLWPCHTTKMMSKRQERVGVMFGSGIGGLETTYNAAITLKEKGPSAGLVLLWFRACLSIWYGRANLYSPQAIKAPTIASLPRALRAHMRLATRHG